MLALSSMCETASLIERMLSKSYTRVRVRACARACVCIHEYNYSLYTLRICTVRCRSSVLSLVPAIYCRHSIWIVIIISTRVIQGVVKIQSSEVMCVRLNADYNFMVADVRPFSCNDAFTTFGAFWIPSYACQLPTKSEFIRSLDAEFVTR
jgi:hypothetical protein